MAERNLFLKNHDNMHTNKKEEIKSLEEVAAEEQEVTDIEEVETGTDEQDLDNVYEEIENKYTNGYMNICRNRKYADLKHYEVLASNIMWKNKPINDNEILQEKMFGMIKHNTKKYTISIPQIAELLQNGCTIQVSSKDFNPTILWLDFDDISKDLLDQYINELTEQLGAKPIIISQSFRGNGYHVAYAFERTVTLEEYEHIYKFMAHLVPYCEYIDWRCYNVNRLMFGTKSENLVEVISDDFITSDSIEGLLSSYEYNKTNIDRYYSSVNGKSNSDNTVAKIHLEDIKNYDDITSKYYTNDYYGIRDYIRNIDIDALLAAFYSDYWGDRELTSDGQTCLRCPIHHGEKRNFKTLKYNGQYENAYKCFSECGGTVYDSYDILSLRYQTKNALVLYVLYCNEFGIEPTLVELKQLKYRNNGISVKHTSQRESEDKEGVPNTEEVEVTLADFDLEKLDTIVDKDRKGNYKKTAKNIRIIMNFLGIRFRCNSETNGLEIYGNISLLEGELTSINGTAASIENLLVELDYKTPLKTVKLYLKDIVSKLGVLEEESFNQKKAVDIIMKKYKVKTFGKDIYLFIDGGYVKDREEKLQTAVWNILPEGVATANVRDSICKVIASNTCVLSTDDRDYISFANGLLNVKTWELEPNSDAVFCIYKKKANYKPFDKEEFEQSALKRYLDTTFKGNQKLIDLFQLILANAIRPNPKKFTYLVHFLGDGSNGKSLAVNIIKEVATAVSTQGIETLGTNNFSTSGLVGSNVNICSETNSATIRNSAMLKALATGDIINVEYKFQQPKSMEIPILMIFNENTMPRCTDTTDGWNRRQLIVPFEQKFVHKDELERNPFALPIDIALEPTIINKEKDLLFSWVIEGLKKLMSQDYKIEVPRECRRMKEKYEGENDPIGSYIKYLKDSSNGEYERVTIEEFRDKLYRWCNECGVYSTEEEATDTILGVVLSRAGFRKTKDSNRGGKHVYSIPKVIEI